MYLNRKTQIRGITGKTNEVIHNGHNCVSWIYKGAVTMADSYEREKSKEKRAIQRA